MKHPVPVIQPRRTQGSLRLLSSVLCLAALATTALAQTAPAAANPNPPASPKPEEEIIQLNAFVVTGSVNPRTQLESPVAITMLDRGRIDDLGSRNFAELLKAVPGLYAESTGGEAFNNVSVRGIGTTSGYSYEMLYEDGLPVLATNNLRHGLPDAFTRMNTFVDRVEAMRSGTSNIFASQAPLALINLISREGGPTFGGEATLTTSDYGTLRTDLWVSGPLGKNTTFALGGWYRVDDGVRDLGFTANKGGELLGNIKHTFENGRGYIKASFKVHEDRNLFELPMPLTGGAKFRSVPFGPSLKHGTTSASADQRIFAVQGTPVGDVSFDLADGIYSQMDYLGTEIQYQLADGIKVENRNRYSDGFRSIDYIFNGVSVPWQNVANAAAGRDPAQFAAGLSGGNYSFRLTYPGQNNLVAAASPAAAASLGNGLGNRKSKQHSDGLITDFQNDLRLIGTFNDDRTTATAGVYYSFLREEQHFLHSTLLTDVSPEARRVDITILNAATGAPIAPATFNGIFHVGDQFRNSTGEEREVSPYALIEHKAGPVTLDAGFRYNNTRQVLTREFTANNFTTNGSSNPALKNGQFGTGNFENRTNRAHPVAYTGGANYAFSDHLAVYGRYSRGVRTLGITEFADDVVAGRAASPSRIITGYEAGVKFGSRQLGVVLTGFYERIKGIQDSQVTLRPDGTLGPTVVAIQRQTSKGVELESIWTPLRGLSLGANGTWQDPKWTDHNLKTQTLSTGQVVVFDEHGLRPERTPKFFGKLMGSYQFPAMELGTLVLNASYQYTGTRPVDRANGPINPLTSYGETQAGISFVTKNGFSFRVTVNNVFDNRGLSEGDPRAGSNVLDPTVSVFNARPIQPRSATASVGYRF